METCRSIYPQIACGRIRSLVFVGNAEQVIAPKRETATFLKTLRVKFYVVAGGFALGERRRWIASCVAK